MKKRGLGKGLEALLGQSLTVTAPDESEQNYANVSLAQLQANPHQPRQEFDPQAIAELAQSIKQHGILQPIAVRIKDAQTNPIQYEIIAGERRYRAALQLKLASVPVVIHDIDAQQSATLALIENLQREDLGAMEKAHGIEKLIAQFDLTHAACAELLGLSRTAVSNLLRLLSLEPPAQQALQQKQIDMGHARALLGLEKSVQYEVLQQVIAKGYSVRETEALVRDYSLTTPPNRSKTAAATSAIGKSAWLKQLPDQLHQQSQAEIWIKTLARQDGSGKLIIEFKQEAALLQFLSDLQSAATNPPKK